MNETLEDIALFIQYHLDLRIDDILVFYDADDTQILRTYLQERLNGCGYSVYALTALSELQPHLTPPKHFEPI
ncbi:MAG: hypothetical protein P8Q23_03710 [Paracoccaceae bacterium]|nr:hypothetical protein [Paracoccaceae bacterium]